MPQVRSRVNGLIVNIPADARGVVGRFASQGGNELIFDQRQRSVAQAPRDDGKMTVVSEAPDRTESASGHEADIA